LHLIPWGKDRGIDGQKDIASRIKLEIRTSLMKANIGATAEWLEAAFGKPFPGMANNDILQGG
jgi:hypothetical protein